MKKNIYGIRKDYEKRKDILYEMFDISEPSNIKTMVRCGECHKKWKAKEENIICPICGRKIEINAIELSINNFKLYNASTTLFIDTIERENGEKEIIASISMLMLSVRRFSRDYYPTIGEDAVRLKIRYNLTKKTALIYSKPIRKSEYQFCHLVGFNYPYINFTQPTIPYFDNKNVDIKLPKELIDDVSELMNVEIPEDAINSVDIYTLAWLNRVRDYDEAIWQRNILSILAERERDTCFFNEEEKNKIYKKATNRVKRYLATGHKPKQYDENTFNALCMAFDIGRESVPKEFEKYYYLNPYALRFVKEHDVLFENRDIRINAIKSVKKHDTPSFAIYGDTKFKEKALFVFGNENRIYKKIERYGDYEVFSDTVNMVSKIKEKGHKFKTKGNLYDVHDRASKMMRYLEAPDIAFDNTKDEDNIIYSIKKEEYQFTFAKTPKELLSLGDKTNTCVGSYYRYCMSGGTMIVYIKKGNEPIGILELAERWGRKPSLVQAKGINNRALPIKIQRLVSSFCMDYGLVIGTRDISNEISNTHNRMLYNINKKTQLNFIKNEKEPMIFEVPF